MTTQLEQAARLALEYLEKYEYAEARTALRAALEKSASGIKQVIYLYDSPEQPAQDDVEQSSTQSKETFDQPVALETVYETIIQWDEGGGKRSRRELARRIVDLYTRPPKRPWVGLTDEELKPLCAENHIIFGAYTVDFVRAIEAKLKEKNS